MSERPPPLPGWPAPGQPDWAVPELASALKISETDLLHGPPEGDARLPPNVSSAYTGLDLEVAEHVIGMGYTS